MSLSYKKSPTKNSCKLMHTRAIWSFLASGLGVWYLDALWIHAEAMFLILFALEWTVFALHCTNWHKSAFHEIFPCTITLLFAFYKNFNPKIPGFQKQCNAKRNFYQLALHLLDWKQFQKIFSLVWKSQKPLKLTSFGPWRCPTFKNLWWRFNFSGYFFLL